MNYLDDVCCLLSVNLLSFWVIFSPDPLEFIKMMRPQDRPITRQVVKVVHDDSHKQVDDLGRIRNESEINYRVRNQLSIISFRL